VTTVVDRVAPTGSAVSRVLRGAGAYRGWVLAAALLSFLSLGAGIGLVAMSAYLISRSALVESTATLALTIVGVRAFALTRVVSRYAERYVGHLGTFRILTRLRVWVFRGILPGAPASLLDRRSGEVLVGVVDDVDTLQDLYLRVLVPPLAGALAVGVGAAVLGVFQPVLAVTLLAYVMICGVVLPFAARRIGRHPTGALVAVQAEIGATTVEGVAGIADLLAFGRTELLVDRLDALTRAQTALRRELAVARGMTAGLTALLVGAAAMSVLLIGITMVTAGDLDPVMLAVLPLVAIATFEAVGPVAASVEHLDRCRAASRRLVDLVDAPPMVVEPDPSSRPDAPVTGRPIDLDVEHLSFAYDAERPVLRDVSFRVPAGSTVALVGTSGSGKSTLTALLLRFWDHDEGRILLGGTSVTELGPDRCRRLVSVVAQHDHLFDTTLRDNLSLGDEDPDDDRIWTACRDAAVDDAIRALPLGLDERAGPDGSRLSGGERQRVMIARALLTDAPLLVLDEATAHLDPETARLVLRRVVARRAGLTTIVITHDPGIVPDADLVLEARDGTIVTVGAPHRHAAPSPGPTSAR
jgi:thiol reductant ABC exporter CydC subunit